MLEHSPGWTDDRVTTLRALFADGLSGSQIAGELGITRNAAIGKLHRIGLRRSEEMPHPRRPSPPRQPRRAIAKVQRVKVRAPANGGPTIVESVVYEPDPEIAAFDTSVPVGQRCTLLELTDERCKWPIGDPCDADFYFCGGKTHKDSPPYCGYHGRIAYLPAPARRNGNPPPAHYLSGPGGHLKAFIA